MWQRRSTKRGSTSCSEFLRIPSVSARPVARGRRRRRGRVDRGEDPPERRRGGARPVGTAAARDRRDPCVAEPGRSADGPLLRALRRAAAGAARPLGVGPVRCRRSAASGSTPAASPTTRVSSGCSLQAAGLLAAEGRATDQHPHHLGRRGGGRRPVDRRVPRSRTSAARDACVIFDGGMENRNLPARDARDARPGRVQPPSSAPARATSTRGCTATLR